MFWVITCLAPVPGHADGTLLRECLEEPALNKYSVSMPGTLSACWACTVECMWEHKHGMWVYACQGRLQEPEGGHVGLESHRHTGPPVLHTHDLISRVGCKRAYVMCLTCPCSAACTACLPAGLWLARCVCHNKPLVTNRYMVEPLLDGNVIINSPCRSSY